jgi:ComF family protein
VPIPLSRLRLLTRRFNQAQILAQSVAKLSGKPVEPLALRRRHGRAHQAGLSRNERLRNVSGMFSVAPHAVATISGRRIVLIDDVITTGATVSAATRALRTAGAARVDVLALALTLNH